MLKYLHLIIAFFIITQSFAQSSQIDSLKAVLPTMKEDTSKVKHFIELGNRYRFLEIDSSFTYFHKAIELAEKIDAKGFEADALIDVGINHQIQGTYDSTKQYFQKSLEIASEMSDRMRIEIYYAQNASLYHDMGLYDSAVDNYFKCLTMAKERGTESGQAWLYNCIGVVYYDQGLFDESVSYFLKALNIREKQGDKWQMTVGYNNIGEIYRLQDMPDKALEYFEKAISIHEQLLPYEDREQGSSLATTYNNIGEIYYSRDSIDRAKDYYLKALLIFEEMGLKRRMAESTQLLGDIYLKKGDYRLAREYYSSALELYQESGDKRGLANIYVEMANLEIRVADSYDQTEARRMGCYENALQLAGRSYTLAREMDMLPIINDAAHVLMIAHSKLGNYKNGMNWAMTFIDTKDSMYREDKIRAIQDMNTKYETEKKQQQIELQTSQLIAKDATIKQQRTFRNALVGGVAAILIIGIIITIAYLQKRKDNKKIIEQNDKIIKANDELKQLNETITSQNDEIVNSILYAQRIQSAVLPPEAYITELLNENFIFHKPKDIVSGDFYWVKQVNNYIILVCADCTGHGVPGAFMSMLGISYLNEIVQRREITQANQVLNELRKEIKHSLRQTGKKDESRDGIDMALCVIDTKNNMMQYAGAYNPLYIISNKNGKTELHEIKADMMPVGVHFSSDKSFTNHEIKLEIGDTFYISSDGFIDQIGGSNNTRYGSKKFKKLLLDIYDHPLYEQKEILEQTLKDWMGEHPQRDDILVIGARI